MENLSDSDLQTLLQNFKDLSNDEQHNLINYLKKLEAYEPERVERLRKFVNLDPSLKPKEEEGEDSSESKSKSATGRSSPFSNRQGSVNPTVEDIPKIELEDEEMEEEKVEKVAKTKENLEGKLHLDSEEEEYTFEDVVKSVSKNVKEKELESNMQLVKDSMKFETNKAKNEVNLSNAKALISNLMSNFSKTSSNSIDLLGLGVSSAPSISTSTSTATLLTSSADFAKTLSSISVANLASIVSNVKKFSPGEFNEKASVADSSSTARSLNKLNFDPSQLNRPQSPNLMDRNRSVGFQQNFGDGRGNRPMERLGPGMGHGGLPRGFDGPEVDFGGLPRGYVGQGRDDRGLMGFGRDPGLVRDIDPRDIGPSRGISLGRDVGQGRDLGLGRDMGMERDLGMAREMLSGRDIGPGRDMGYGEPDFGARDRSFVQYPRNPAAYAPNYGSNYPQQQNLQYPNTGPRPGGFEQRRLDNNPRFGAGLSNPYIDRPGTDSYNRW